MATKGALIGRWVYPPGIPPRTRSIADASGRSDRMGDHTRPIAQSIKSIAIVDDEKELCTLFSMLVRSLGYRAECVAYDGDEIVQLVLEDSIHPDLILMDYRMPTMNGLQAAERIRRVRPEMKIIIATADDSVRRDVTAAGIYFLQKPFSISALSRMIEEAVGR
jgi:CheY-like chemotaxis protein